MWRIFKSRSIPPLCVRSLSCDFEEISSCRGLVKLVKLVKLLYPALNESVTGLEPSRV